MRPAADTDTVPIDAWRDLIVRRCGLTFRGTQMPAVMASVAAEMRAAGVGSEAEYYERLALEADAGPDWARLVERLLNHETSFFRHPASFETLRTVVLPALRESRGKRSRLNFLSAGCSTGQEAYSLAMLARASEDSETPPLDFTVWGTDLSRASVEFARRARYGPRAVAGVPREYRPRFFHTLGSELSPEYEVVPALRERVRFTTSNLLSKSAVSLNHDVIFCHNVLIYFSPAVASQVVALLASRLTLGGYLFLGPGEGPSERPPGLEALPVNGVRVFRRRNGASVEVPA
jgi:chemotaxis methyl-accepting protein methylase